MVSKIEALIDAIALHNRANSPESPVYQLRNPLLLRSFAVGLRHETDDDGHRVFNSVLAGYKAAIYDVAIKVGGKSRVRLKPDHSLKDLLGVYGVLAPDTVKSAVNFLRRALADPSIRHDMPIAYFYDEAAAYLGKNKGSPKQRATRLQEHPDIRSPKDIPCDSNHEPSI
jgi:hypothetical protein